MSECPKCGFIPPYPDPPVDVLRLRVPARGHHWVSDGTDWNFWVQSSRRKECDACIRSDGTFHAPKGVELFLVNLMTEEKIPVGKKVNLD